ncbi:hypothetical protein GCM10011579_039760 [Streptomyces albiflavescens]|uniref:Lipoprotein n=1 Tax=Streptomyces albiflavescens TaxID=1623582 RepID=A0A917Y5G5_9ACTN|nr:hypothetical protein GCM10011579_039760 [Streptomyces albiflavescens]
MKATRTKGAVVAAAAVLALAGCGSDSDGGSGSKNGASSSPTVQADPYLHAPWRMQVVNLLDALRTPQDGTYRAWMSDSAAHSLSSFDYTPRSAGEPGWDDRDYEGSAMVYPSQLSKTEKNAFFKALTQDDTVIASTLKVTRAELIPQSEDKQDYKFVFKVKTTGGKWLTGRAFGSGGLESAGGQVKALNYDIPKS